MPFFYEFFLITFAAKIGIIFLSLQILIEKNDKRRGSNSKMIIQQGFALHNKIS